MTKVNLDSVFSSLESQATILNRVSDAANQTLEDVENRLIASNVGIETWYQRPLEITGSKGGLGNYETTEHFATLLGFARVNGKWGLAVKKVKRVGGFFEGEMDCPYQEEFIESDPVPLLKQSRNLRLNATEALPDFLEQIVEDVSRKIASLSAATKKLGS